MDGLRLYVEYKGAQDRRRRRGRHETFTAHTAADTACNAEGKRANLAAADTACNAKGNSPLGGGAREAPLPGTR